MKHFLHWSSCIAIGSWAPFIYRAHGIEAAILFIVCAVYAMAAQWYEGKHFW